MLNCVFIGPGKRPLLVRKLESADGRFRREGDIPYGHLDDWLIAQQNEGHL